MPQASRANILPYGSGATPVTRQGTAHLLLEVSLPQRFCPDVPRIPGRKGIYRQECTGRRRLDMPTFRYPVCWPFAAFPSHQPADAGFLLYAMQPDTQRMYCPVCPSAVTGPATSQVTWSALAHT